MKKSIVAITVVLMLSTTAAFGSQSFLNKCRSYARSMMTNPSNVVFPPHQALVTFNTSNYNENDVVGFVDTDEKGRTFHYIAFCQSGDMPGDSTITIKPIDSWGKFKRYMKHGYASNPTDNLIITWK